MPSRVRNPTCCQLHPTVTVASARHATTAYAPGCLRHACRGKLLNVRDATATQVAENQEIQNLKQILGLQYKKQYSDTKSLRYGHLMIMTDQDHDGSHIKGLIMNFLHAHYPELLQLPGFLAEFITPIVKVGSGALHSGCSCRLPCSQTTHLFRRLLLDTCNQMQGQLMDPLLQYAHFLVHIALGPP